MSKKIQAIIFDCDGVLVDSEKLSCGVFAEMMRENGADVTNDEVLLAIKGGSIEHSLAYASKYLSTINPVRFEAEYRKRSYEIFRTQMTPVKGIENLLNSLSLPRSIVSNGPSSKIFLNLEKTDLLKYFNKALIFSGHDVKKFKPDPYLFIKAAEKMNINPENCLVIEDSAHGAAAAQAANMLCYGYTETTNPNIFLPYNAIPFSSMDEIRTIIA